MAPPLSFNDIESLVNLLTGNLQVGGLHLGVPQYILRVEAVTMSALESDPGAVQVMCDFFRRGLFGEHVPPGVRFTGSTSIDAKLTGHQDGFGRGGGW
jgi:hypothetical protein